MAKEAPGRVDRNAVLARAMKARDRAEQEGGATGEVDAGQIADDVQDLVGALSRQDAHAQEMDARQAAGAPTGAPAAGRSLQDAVHSAQGAVGVEETVVAVSPPREDTPAVVETAVVPETPLAVGPVHDALLRGVRAEGQVQGAPVEVDTPDTAPVEVVSDEQSAIDTPTPATPAVTQPEVRQAPVVDTPSPEAPRDSGGDAPQAPVERGREIPQPLSRDQLRADLGEPPRPPETPGANATTSEAPASPRRTGWWNPAKQAEVRQAPKPDDLAPPRREPVDAPAQPTPPHAPLPPVPPAPPQRDIPADPPVPPGGGEGSREAGAPAPEYSYADVYASPEFRDALADQIEQGGWKGPQWWHIGGGRKSADTVAGEAQSVLVAEARAREDGRQLPAPTAYFEDGMRAQYEAEGSARVLERQGHVTMAREIAARAPGAARESFREALLTDTEYRDLPEEDLADLVDEGITFNRTGRNWRNMWLTPRRLAYIRDHKPELVQRANEGYRRRIAEAEERGRRQLEAERTAGVVEVEKPVADPTVAAERDAARARARELEERAANDVAALQTSLEARAHDDTETLRRTLSEVQNEDSTVNVQKIAEARALASALPDSPERVELVQRITALEASVPRSVPVESPAVIREVVDEDEMALFRREGVVTPARLRALAGKTSAGQRLSAYETEMLIDNYEAVNDLLATARITIPAAVIEAVRPATPVEPTEPVAPASVETPPAGPATPEGVEVSTYEPSDVFKARLEGLLYGKEGVDAAEVLRFLVENQNNLTDDAVFNQLVERVGGDEKLAQKIRVEFFADQVRAMRTQNDTTQVTAPAFVPVQQPIQPTQPAQPIQPVQPVATQLTSPGGTQPPVPPSGTPPTDGARGAGDETPRRGIPTDGLVEGGDRTDAGVEDGTTADDHRRGIAALDEATRGPRFVSIQQMMRDYFDDPERTWPEKLKWWAVGAGLTAAGVAAFSLTGGIAAVAPALAWLPGTLTAAGMSAGAAAAATTGATYGVVGGAVGAMVKNELDMRNARNRYQRLNPEAEVAAFSTTGERLKAITTRAVPGAIIGGAMGGVLEATGVAQVLRDAVASTGETLGNWVGMDDMRSGIATLDARVSGIETSIGDMGTRMRALETLPAEMRNGFDDLWAALRRGDANISDQIAALRGRIGALDRAMESDVTKLLDRIEALRGDMEGMTSGTRVYIEQYIRNNFFFDSPPASIYGPIITGQELGAPNINKAISAVMNEAGLTITGNQRGVLIDAIVREATTRMDTVIGSDITSWRAVPDGRTMDLRFLLSDDALRSIASRLEDTSLYRMDDAARDRVLIAFERLVDGIDRYPIDLTVTTTPSR